MKPTLTHRQGNYSEGVVLDYEGNLYFSHGEIITVLRPDGSHDEWARTGAPNGHKVLEDGTHLVCDGSRHAVLHLAADGTVLGNASDSCDGRPLRAPNDLTLDEKHGGFYFTDPGGSAEEPIGTVHYVDAKGETRLVHDGLLFPNGIVLRPDGKTLLVAESKQNRILVFDVLAPGEVGEPRVFCELPVKSGSQVDNQPDGMCLDLFGNLYVAHYGMGQVQVIDRKGRIIRQYAGGNLLTSNVAFAPRARDDKLNQLYVTGGEPDGESGGFYRLDLSGPDNMGASGMDVRPYRESDEATPE